jgi:hypothetical protein
MQQRDRAKMQMVFCKCSEFEIYNLEHFVDFCQRFLGVYMYCWKTPSCVDLQKRESKRRLDIYRAELMGNFHVFNMRPRTKY